MDKVKQKRILSFHPCFAGQRQVILGSRKLNHRHHRLIMNADAIILPQACSQDLYQACRVSSAALFPNYDTRFQYRGKTGQAFLFKELGLPHPETVPWNSVAQFENSRHQNGVSHGFPFLIKANQSHEGDGVFLISGSDDLESTLRVLREWEKTGQHGFLSQELIATHGNVLRAVVLENRIFTYWKRPALQGTLITTLSRNAVVDKDWRIDLQEKGRVQAQILAQKTGINVAALDYVFPMEDSDPYPLLLEINYYFGRRGLGGSLTYYRLLHQAVQEWLQQKNFDPALVRLL